MARLYPDRKPATARSLYMGIFALHGNIMVLNRGKRKFDTK